MWGAAWRGEKGGEMGELIINKIYFKNKKVFIPRGAAF